MTPWLDDGDVRLYHGDALEQLALMPSESVQCIVTSPPFWGLRDYGTGSWSGGDEDCDHAERELRRGVNLAASAHSTRGGAKKAAEVGWLPYRSECGKCGALRTDQQIGLEETPEEWCQRLVEVMREARRVLRSDGVLWLELGDGYCSTAPGTRNTLDEKLGAGAAERAVMRAETPAGMKPKDLVGAPWMLAFALRADGWYLRSDTIWSRPNPMPESVVDRPTKAHSYVFLLSKSARYYYDADAIREPHAEQSIARAGRARDTAYAAPGQTPQRRTADENGLPAAGANARSVWSIATESSAFAHFATMPQALAERCIKAGSAEGDLVLDPFAGSGTTCLVARRLGRRAVGIELSAEYLSIAAERLQQLALPL